jgi:ubiquinone/menaquinone biosynthesis C-methylase UbiE
MGIASYFSKDEEARAHFIFNLIAPVYGIIDKGTHGDFKKMAGVLNGHISLKGKSVLDVGCGTGAWLTQLQEYNLQGTAGVDFTEKMLKIARQKHPGVQFVLQHGENLSHFEDNSFDIVTATFVLHGMKAEKRSKVLQEMKRVARQQVVIHDYYGPTEPVAWFLEFLEKSDYKNFKKQFPMEMQAHFTETTLLNGVRGRALYIGTV